MSQLTNVSVHPCQASRALLRSQGTLSSNGLNIMPNEWRFIYTVVGGQLYNGSTATTHVHFIRTLRSCVCFDLPLHYLYATAVSYFPFQKVPVDSGTWNTVLSVRVDKCKQLLLATQVPLPLCARCNVQTNICKICFQFSFKFANNFNQSTNGDFLTYVLWLIHSFEDTEFYQWVSLLQTWRLRP